MKAFLKSKIFISIIVAMLGITGIVTVTTVTIKQKNEKERAAIEEKNRIPDDEEYDEFIKEKIIASKSLCIVGEEKDMFEMAYGNDEKFWYAKNTGVASVLKKDLNNDGKKEILILYFKSEENAENKNAPNSLYIAIYEYFDSKFNLTVDQFIKEKWDTIDVDLDVKLYENGEDVFIISECDIVVALTSSSYLKNYEILSYSNKALTSHFALGEYSSMRNDYYEVSIIKDRDFNNENNLNESIYKGTVETKEEGAVAINKKLSENLLKDVYYATDEKEKKLLHCEATAFNGSSPYSQLKVKIEDFTDARKMFEYNDEELIRHLKEDILCYNECQAVGIYIGFFEEKHNNSVESIEDLQTNKTYYYVTKFQNPEEAVGVMSKYLHPVLAKEIYDRAKDDFYETNGKLYYRVESGGYSSYELDTIKVLNLGAGKYLATVDKSNPEGNDPGDHHDKSFVAFSFETVDDKVVLRDIQEMINIV